MNPQFIRLLFPAALASVSCHADESHGDGGNSISEPGAKIERVPTPVIPGNTIPKGTSLKMFADHAKHNIVNPTAFAFDEQGNLYLAETPRFGRSVVDNRQHRYWLLDDIASETVEDRLAMHEKWKDRLPLEKLTEFSDDIRRFTDSNGDGRADKVTVFADGFDGILEGTGAGVFAHEGKVYYANIPKIHILEDTTGDGTADKRDFVAEGFGVRVSLSGHDLNGFALGNDGRIYSTIGDRGFSLTTREGKKYHYPNQGAVMRFEPDGSNFEVIHTGLRNPKEIAFDEWGNGVTVDNNSDQGDLCRIVYVMEGVDSGWRTEHQNLFTFREEIGLKENPISPWMTERMSLVRNDDQPQFIVPPVANLTNGPSGLTYHPGSGFMESERGRFLICDFRGNPSTSGIWSFRVSRDGAGMTMENAYQMNWGVAATDVEYSYDGRVFVADFITGWGGARQGQIYALTADSEENSGRTPDVAKIMSEGFHHRPNAELAKLFFHADQRVRLRAHLALAAKDDGNALLTSAATSSAPLLTRLHGVWGLGVRARKGGDSKATTTLVSLLGDEESEVRAQAAQILGEVESFDGAKLIPLLSDESLRVRSFAALSLGRHKTKAAAGPLVSLIEENADRDLYLRHAAIMGLLGAADAAEIAKLASHESPSVRMAAVIALRRLESPLLASFLKDEDTAIVDETIRAIHDAPVEEVRPAVAALLDAHLGEKKARDLKPMIARRLIHSAFRVGGMENASRLISAASSPQLEEGQRREALRLLRQWDDPHPVDQSLGRWDLLPERDASPVSALLAEGTANLLEGDPKLLEPTLQLVRALELGEKAAPTDTLRTIATAADLPGPARSLALEMWIERKPADADEVLVSLAADPSDDVASEVLAILVDRDPAKATEGVTLALGSEKVARRQAAWTIAGAIPGDTAASLIANGLKKLTEGTADAKSQIELLEAAAKRTESSVKDALAHYQSSLDPAEPLAAWLPSLEGGNAEVGKDLFLNHGPSQCIRCHRVGDSDESGILAGPNLSGIAARHDRRYLLESLMIPGAAIAPGYGVVSLTLKNGKNIGGILIGETAEHYDLTVGDDTWRVSKTDVASATPPVSAMPPVAGLLTPRETRDMVAYLATLTEPLKHAPPPPQPKPFDPETDTP